MIEQEKKELGKWWIWILILLLGTIVVLTTTGYLGKIMGTVVERKVFENSYQRSEAMKSQMITWQAQLASIESQLMSNPNDLGLVSQKRMLEVQIATTKGMK